MNLDLIPLAPGWEWHKWTNRKWGTSTRWLYNRVTGVYRCTDCGQEFTHCTSLAGHNRAEVRAHGAERSQVVVHHGGH